MEETPIIFKSKRGNYEDAMEEKSADVAPDY
jgi:hypothetical protein